MHVLLPPSETKRHGGTAAFDPEKLAHAAQLGAARLQVRCALEELCRDEEEAARVLKLGIRSRGEIAQNLALDTSGTMPAIDRYTGVLYDALGAGDLNGAARSWLDAHVSVQSALFGLIAASDAIPGYRLSAGSRLPLRSGTLKSVWAAAHAAIDWRRLGWTLDLRSKDYAALAPLPAAQGEALAVVQRAPDGEVRALNHFNKAAKGDLVRRLARSGAQIAHADEFQAWASAEGLEVHRDPVTHGLVLVTGPAAAAAPGDDRPGSLKVG